jgi:hypothetical protein
MGGCDSDLGPALHAGRVACGCDFAIIGTAIKYLFTIIYIYILLFIIIFFQIYSYNIGNSEDFL